MRDMAGETIVRAPLDADATTAPGTCVADPDAIREFLSGVMDSDAEYGLRLDAVQRAHAESLAAVEKAEKAARKSADEELAAAKERAARARDAATAKANREFREHKRAIEEHQKELGNIETRLEVRCPGTLRRGIGQTPEAVTPRISPFLGTTAEDHIALVAKRVSDARDVVSEYEKRSVSRDAAVFWGWAAGIVMCIIIWCAFLPKAHLPAAQHTFVFLMGLAIPFGLAAWTIRASRQQREQADRTLGACAEGRKACLVALDSATRERDAAIDRSDRERVAAVDFAKNQYHSRLRLSATEHHDSSAAAEGACRDAMSTIGAQLAQLAAGYREFISRCLSVREGGSLTDRPWEGWEPAGSAAPALRVGTLRVATPNFARLFPEQVEFVVPALLPFRGGRGLLVEVAGERGAANGMMQSAMLRLLATIPPGKVKFICIDPVELGHNVSAFMHLQDYDDSLVTGKAWTEPQQIERILADITEHMETVIQKYLRQDYPTIEDYNEKAGEVAEPYRVVVVFDFPVNFSETATRRLVSIMRNGPRCGVYPFVVMDTKKPLPYGVQRSQLEEFAVVLKDGRQAPASNSAI